MIWSGLFGLMATETSTGRRASGSVTRTTWCDCFSCASCAGSNIRPRTSTTDPVMEASLARSTVQPNGLAFLAVHHHFDFLHLHRLKRTITRRAAGWPSYNLVHN